MRDIQTNEIEWYLRDHFFRQFNQGIKHFKMESLGGEMISLYLRYRNYNLQDMNNMITAAVENLISLRVIKKTENYSLELTSRCEYFPLFIDWIHWSSPIFGFPT